MASTKLIILQGISGTGKTSLPYSFGKFLQVDTTIASVQPSWRDRTELFGYFNEFTKSFNETEVLTRIYSSSYNNDINLILLDEMNIARVEYYFAEMLSILEMPNADEWELEIVPNVWSTDPVHLDRGKIVIPQNVWYIGTANNDDSTFSIADKVYDRAQPINLDAKGISFDAPDTPPIHMGFDHLTELFEEAFKMYPISQENLKKIQQLDLCVIEKLRVAFGNRILMQMGLFVPVYVACGGEELDGIDYVLATKIFRKFESLNLAMLRDELKELCIYLTKVFGKGHMKESIAYLERLQKLF
jgi:5-methylcytosine-specific restriction endonuclease McrBC GTP-binding regulatory subunit McrB